MGIGDEIMAVGQAKLLHTRTGAQVVIVDRIGRPRWHPIWDYNPRLLRTKTGRMQILMNGPGVRPYVMQKTADRWTWRRFDLQPGEIYFTEPEVKWGAQRGGRIVVEPNVKGTNEGNKDWGWERWVEFARRTPNLVQVGPSGTRLLPGVDFVETPEFRMAAAVLGKSLAYVGTEGALHHAAAAMGVPAVVIFGGFISPDITGYASHRNLFTGGVACGSRLACQHCRDSMAAISVDDVIQNLSEILR
jgi:hypothetical protein